MLIEPKDPPAVWVVTSPEKEEGLAKDTVASVVAKRAAKRDITCERCYVTVAEAEYVNVRARVQQQNQENNYLFDSKMKPTIFKLHQLATVSGF